MARKAVTSKYIMKALVAQAVFFFLMAAIVAWSRLALKTSDIQPPRLLALILTEEILDVLVCLSLGLLLLRTRTAVSRDPKLAEKATERSIGRARAITLYVLIFYIAGLFFNMFTIPSFSITWYFWVLIGIISYLAHNSVRALSRMEKGVGGKENY